MVALLAYLLEACHAFKAVVVSHFFSTVLVQAQVVASFDEPRYPLHRRAGLTHKVLVVLL